MPEKAERETPTGGLKLYLPTLARMLGTTPAALYERQRALVRVGLLIPEKGRGPGSGVQIDAGGYSVAWLLIAVLATDNLSETDQRVAEIARTAPRPSSGYRKTFVDALAEILTTLREAKSVTHVTIDRTAKSAEIGFRNQQPIAFRKSEPAVSKVPRHDRLSIEPGSYSLAGAPAALQVKATLSGATIAKIADDLWAMFEEAQSQAAQHRESKP
jgi:hypothetical protein